MRMTNNGEDVTVLYHGGGCRDGFCAAWCMRMLYPAATFVPVNYGGDMPDVTGRRVFFVDFCPTETQLRGFCRANPEVTVLDHHATAEPILTTVKTDNLHVVFDKTRSGARLAWEHICAESGRHDAGLVPWLVRYVEDRDLWRWQLPNSREINAAIRLTDLDFTAWDALAQMDALDLVGRGEAVLMRDAEIVESHVRHAVPQEVAGHTVPVVNATVLQSEIGHALCKGHPFAAMYFDDLAASVRRWSLRSDEDGLDVSEIAKALGGGGHKHAAGFQTRFAQEAAS
jgi:uncharacterized protein